jgi:hypothetical protein
MGFAKDPRISLWALKQTTPPLNCFRIPMSRKPIMSYFNCRTFLMTYTLWIRMVKTLGFTFGDNIDIPPVNTIITISETFSPI